MVKLALRLIYEKESPLNSSLKLLIRNSVFFPKKNCPFCRDSLRFSLHGPRGVVSAPFSNKQTNKQTDRQTDRQTDTHTKKNHAKRLNVVEELLQNDRENILGFAVVRDEIHLSSVQKSRNFVVRCIIPYIEYCLLLTSTLPLQREFGATCFCFLQKRLLSQVTWGGEVVISWPRYIIWIVSHCFDMSNTAVASMS